MNTPLKKGIFDTHFSVDSRLGVFYEKLGFNVINWLNTQGIAVIFWKLNRLVQQ